MKWGAHEADGRIAANNAKKIRAALGASVNVEQLYERYKETHPAITEDPAQDRARARAWVMLHLVQNTDALYMVYRRMYAEAFVTAELAAKEALKRLERAQKAPMSDYVDWSKWYPGNAAAAALARKPGFLMRLLEDIGQRISLLSKETYDLIGTALADSIAVGATDAQAARLINQVVKNPKRSLAIAITETNRIMSQTAMNSYREAGLEYQEWQASSPCDACAINEGQVVPIGSPFNSGVTAPPQHPNCRCALLPVIPDFEDLAPKFAKVSNNSLEEALSRVTIEWIE